MHLLLTDVLTCPRCGPRFGLIVLADRMDDRDVVEGALGCANCRESYPIRGGVADLRFPPDTPPLAAGDAPAAAEEAALRAAALLGVRDRPGPVLLAGLGDEVAAGVARLLPESRVAAAGGGGAPSAGAGGVSRVRLGSRLPFRDGALRGVYLAGGRASDLLDEAIRTLDPQARVVLDPAPAEAASRLASRGLRVLLEQDGVVVASPSAAG